MKMHLLSAVVLVSALPMVAQGGPGPMPHGPGDRGPMGFGMRQPVTNAPYSATFTSTSTEKLQDGTVLTHTSTRVALRDSLGRTREEITLPGRGADAKPHTIVMILDPVARTVTRLDTEKKIAVVHTLPAPGEHRGFPGRRGPSAPDQAPPPPAADGQGPAADRRRGPRDEKNVVVADLGSKTVSGVVATGTKTTRTIPAGTMGNSAAIVSTHETWVSPDLKIELTRTDNDPFRGTHTTTVSGLTKAEPDATLFKVPSDYTVQSAERGRPGGFRGAPPAAPSGM